MKRLTALFITLLLLALCVSGAVLTADAAYDDLSVSEDLGTLYVGSTEYKRYNGATSNTYYVDIVAELSLPEDIVYYEIGIDSRSLSYMITYKFADGAVLTSYYLHSDYVEEYEKLIKGESGSFYIDFYYPNDNIVEGKLDQLKGKKTVLDSADLRICDSWDVVTKSDDGMLECNQGQLLIVDGEYYFYETVNRLDRTYLSDLESAEVYTVEDEEMLKKLKGGREDYYDDDMGYLNDDSFINKFSTVFLVFVFGVLPLAALVFAVIRAFSRSSAYRKYYVALAAISLLLLTVVATLASLISSVS